jgi:hypothetical protein
VMRRVILFLILSFVILPSGVFAGIRPSFMLDSCTWNATHIVVVTEGDVIDGNLLVLESLKGDLRTGEIITLADFGNFNKAQLRQVGTEIVFENSSPETYHLTSGKRSPGTTFNPNASHVEAGLTKSITCSRFILFLKRDASGGTSNWKPAATSGGFFVSAVWLESYGTFAFNQVMNPGPSELLPLKSSEEQIRGLVAEILKAKDSIGVALSISEKEKRAEALEPLMRSSSWLVKKLALEGIKDCGLSARPVFQRLIHDTSMLENSIILFASYIETGDEQAGPELTELVRKELQFWRELVPTLKNGWWHVADISAPDNLQKRYDRIYYLLGALGELRFDGCKGLVTELRDFWRSHPVLGERKPLWKAEEI